MVALGRSGPLGGAQALGIARGALGLATGYVHERRQFGSRLADFQGLQFMLADMATQVDAAALLVYRACSLLDAGLPGTASASSMVMIGGSKSYSIIAFAAASRARAIEPAATANID